MESNNDIRSIAVIIEAISANPFKYHNEPCVAVINTPTSCKYIEGTIGFTVVSDHIILEAPVIRESLDNGGMSYLLEDVTYFKFFDKYL